MRSVMIEKFHFAVFRRMGGQLAGLVTAGILALSVAGCGDGEGVQVRLHTRQDLNGRLNFLEIQAQVAGPVSGLHYKWFADSGECQPQETDQPKTVFKFLEGARKDRVSVEVWRNNKQVALSEIKVKFDDNLARMEAPPPPGSMIEITNIP